MRSAEQKLTQAEAGVAELRKGILLQVRKSFFDLETAAKKLAVPRKAVQQAEEAHRIEQVKYTAGSSTTTDLLDAQLALTRARLTTSNALHGWYLARAALARAMGEGLPFNDFTATGGSQ
jgi:outer membrane protein TolC